MCVYSSPLRWIKHIDTDPQFYQREVEYYYIDTEGVRPWVHTYNESAVRVYSSPLTWIKYIDTDPQFYKREI